MSKIEEQRLFWGFERQCRKGKIWREVTTFVRMTCDYERWWNAEIFMCSQACTDIASHADALRARQAFVPHKRLLNGSVTSVRWRLAFVLKEPIRCYLHVDTSVVCHVLMNCLGSFLNKIFAFKGEVWKI